MNLILVINEKGEKAWFEATDTFIFGIKPGEKIYYNASEWIVEYIFKDGEY
jgi:hypothetical protein